MKTLQQIQDEYAKEQGYENWEELFNYNVEYQEYEVLENAFNAVIQIVQEDLKERITEELIWMENPELIKEILNTENIK
ncbi:hypothetical protein [Empedobacter brevis]|uniref:hypothetical protein n=1 Tax=Empedobacter brevis TaxID=247 RepID=UPI00289A9D09|nr:hypothetical protein [Empedobacter brevis]